MSETRYETGANDDAPAVESPAAILGRTGTVAASRRHVPAPPHAADRRRRRRRGGGVHRA